MIEKNAKPTEDHQRYCELCALATTGTLSDRDWADLKSHLSHCTECSKLVQEYRELARTGMAMLMPDSTNDDRVEAAKSWSPELAKSELFARIAHDEMSPQYRMSTDSSSSSAWKIWRRLFHPQPRLLPRYALAILIVTSIFLSAYHLGTRRAQEQASAESKLSNSEVDSLRSQLESLTREHTALNENLQRQSAELHATGEQLQQKTLEVERWKAIQSKLAGDLQQKSSEVSNLQAQQVSANTERDAINRKLQDSQAALQTIQQKYDTLREQNTAQLIRTASLESKIDDLSSKLNETQASNDQQQKFLASDRDIRELMGARNLYIADVFDVDQDGKTQKPFGRAFYTKGKSLIFYAFDLDRQPHLRNASIFQAWGRRGLTDKKPLNMGVFYLDSETNKRWVLKFDDPDALAQIDAVFVTVEPHGGSQKPSGQQLLFASLKSMPNHP